MALSRVKTWIAGEVLNASDLNTEFNSILNNAVSLVSPFTGAVDFDGNTITLDAAAATQLVSSAAVSFNFTSGAKTGTPATTGSVSNWSAQTFTDSNTAGSGTATAFVAHGIQRPTLAATNASVTTTDAATFYIANSPAAGTNETITSAWALWTDDGGVRHDLTKTVPSAASAVLRGMYLPAVTETITGSTNITTATGFNLVEIGIPTLSAASALTITNAATLYIAGAPTGGGAGPATITNAYSLWVDAGAARFDGAVTVTGVLSATSLGIIDAAGDLIYGTAADTAARLAVGTALQRLAVNAGATAPEWVSDTQNAVVDAAGDTIYGTADNTITRLAIGTAGLLYRVNSGATAPEWSAAITLGTLQATTSGTAITFTGIPSWAKRVKLMMDGVSTNGVDDLLVQIGDSGGVEITGYVSAGGLVQNAAASAVASSTAGFIMVNGNAANSFYGVMTISLMDTATNLWVAEFSNRTASTATGSGAGSKALSAALDRVVLTTTGGTNTFDAGSVNISYE